jgi:hypothetical protein
MRRFRSGEAEPTVEAESRYLADWAKERGLRAYGEKESDTIKSQRIRERIKKRYKGAQGYQQVRKHHRMELGLEVP